MKYKRTNQWHDSWIIWEEEHDVLIWKVNVCSTQTAKDKDIPSVGEICQAIQSEFPGEPLDQFEIRLVNRGKFYADLIVRNITELPITNWEPIGGGVNAYRPIGTKRKFIWALSNGNLVLRPAKDGEIQDGNLVPKGSPKDGAW